MLDNLLSLAKEVGELDISGLVNMVSGNKEEGVNNSGGLADKAKGFFN